MERNQSLCEHQLHMQLSCLAKGKEELPKTEFKDPEKFLLDSRTI